MQILACAINKYFKLRYSGRQQDYELFRNNCFGFCGLELAGSRIKFVFTYFRLRLTLAFHICEFKSYVGISYYANSRSLFFTSEIGNYCYSNYQCQINDGELCQYGRCACDCNHVEISSYCYKSTEHAYD